MTPAPAKARQSSRLWPGDRLVLPIVAFLIVRHRLGEDFGDVAAHGGEARVQALRVFVGQDAGRMAFRIGDGCGPAARPFASRAAARPPAARQRAGVEEAGLARRPLGDDQHGDAIIVTAAFCR
ncbi:hypothetical protein [Shinella sp. M31]|uniref:hypothetical protein n=1 Tax=Shinella sp. M31 TaxID=3368615 RepID=UPI003BA25A0D